MKSRTTRDNSDTVSLFPFLAVLLCTMGALLVLLVVLAQKAREQAFDTVVHQARATPRDMSAAAEVAAAETRPLEQQLEQLRRYQRQLSTLRAEAKSRQQEEQLRLSHLEEHTRRLERGLAKLFLASEQLKATEEAQIVDQDQAEHELVRLKEMIEEGRQELESFREQSRGKRSYAIIPYRGPQGTVRRPIYVECSQEGVVIQPEGIRLTAKDFIAPFDSGNPLAKALRAARDLLNARAVKAGETEPPDPYPLLLVRPDGIQQYAAARTAIESWDTDFGYEFINQQWSLQYPETDPELAQTLRHAVMQGRERIAMLIQAAPRRYKRLGISTSVGQRGTGGSGPPGENGGGTFTGSGWGGSGRQAASSHATTYLEGGSGGRAGGLSERAAGTYPAAEGGTMGNHIRVSDSTGNRVPQGRGMINDDHISNGPMGNLSDDQGAHAAGLHEAYAETSSRGSNGVPGKYGEPIQSGVKAGSQPTGSQRTKPGSAGRETKGGTSSGLAGVSAAHGSSPGESASGSASQGSTGSQRGTSSGQARGGIHATSGSPDSKVSARGNHWAMEKPQRGAVPIRRPIQVVIRQDRMVILQSRHVGKNSPYGGAVISLNQPTEQVKEEFAMALRKHMQEWGLAGNGLYWRPILQLNVGPEGQLQATRLAQLLAGSGIEIDSSHTARHNQQVPARATR